MSSCLSRDIPNKKLKGFKFRVNPDKDGYIWISGVEKIHISHFRNALDSNKPIPVMIEVDISNADMVEEVDTVASKATA